jgi:hypothetical protein
MWLDRPAGNYNQRCFSKRLAYRRFVYKFPAIKKSGGKTPSIGNNQYTSIFNIEEKIRTDSPIAHTVDASG